MSRSAFALLAKLPSCTAQAWRGAVEASSAPGERVVVGDDLGGDALVSSGGCAPFWALSVAMLGALAGAGSAALVDRAPALVALLAPFAAGVLDAAASGAGFGAAAGAACEAAPASGSAVALFVARSTDTLRVAVVGKPAASGGNAECFGPDKSSGTTSTITATRIVAPTRRSLRRRSIIGLAVFMGEAAAQYIHEVSRSADALAPRANRVPARRCERSRRRRSDRRRARPRAPPRSRPRRPRRCGAAPADAAPCARRAPHRRRRALRGSLSSTTHRS